MVVASKNKQLLDLLLKQPKINLDLTDKDFGTPLWIALTSSTEDIANLLAEKGSSLFSFFLFFLSLSWLHFLLLFPSSGASLSVQDGEGNTYLHRSIDSRDLFTIKWLLAKEAQVNVQNAKSQTPLHRAALSGMVDVAKLLLQRPDISANTKDDSGQTAVHLAVRSKNPKILTVLLEAPGVNADDVDNEGISPLWEAIVSGQQDTAGTILVEKGANIGAFDRRGNSLLHSAIAQNLLEGALYLIQRGAPITDIDVDHNSCLTFAIMHNKPSVISELCSFRGVNPNARLENGKYPLEFAFEFQREESCQSLVDRGSDVNIVVGDSPLLARVISKQDEFAAVFLINAGAEVNVASNAPQSPLFAASAAGLKKIVAALLFRNADPNWQNDKGLTSLHVSAINNHLEVVEALLACKATNVNLLDKEGQSVFRIVFESRNAPIAAALARNSNNFSSELDSNKCTFLYLAVGKEEGKKDGGDEEGVKFLLDLKVKNMPNGPTQEVSCDACGVFALFLSSSFFLHRLPSSQQTPLHLGARLGRIKMCSLLLEYDPAHVNERNNAVSPVVSSLFLFRKKTIQPPCLSGRHCPSLLRRQSGPKPDHSADSARCGTCARQ